MFRSVILLGLFFSLVSLFGQSKQDSAVVKTDSVSYSVKGMT